MGLEVLPLRGDGGGKRSTETHVRKKHEQRYGNTDGDECKQLLLGSVEIYHVRQGLRRDEAAERQVRARSWVLIHGDGCESHSD